MVRMNFIFILISSSGPKLLRKKSVKNKKIKKNYGLTTVQLTMTTVQIISIIAWPFFSIVQITSAKKDACNSPSSSSKVQDAPIYDRTVLDVHPHFFNRYIHIILTRKTMVLLVGNVVLLSICIC